MEVATDSRATDEGVIVSDNSVKHYEREGVDFFICGTVSDEEPLMAAFLAKRKRVSKTLNDAEALAWDGTTLFNISAEDGRLHWYPALDQFGAIGSGSKYALAAFDAGATPRQAVIAAKKRDTCTGGKVVTYKLKAKQQVKSGAKRAESIVR
jgi:hypothetical protein